MLGTELVGIQIQYLERPSEQVHACFLKLGDGHVNVIVFVYVYTDLTSISSLFREQSVLYCTYYLFIYVFMVYTNISICNIKIVRAKNVCPRLARNTGV